jgi:hypothetical protein
LPGEVGEADVAEGAGEVQRGALALDLAAGTEGLEANYWDPVEQAPLGAPRGAISGGMIIT